MAGLREKWKKQMLTSFRKCMETDEFIQWCIKICAGDTLL